MNPFIKPDRSRTGEVQPKSALEAARNLSLAAMDKFCEIQAPGEESEGFGIPDGVTVPAGRVRCGIAQGTRGSETERPDLNVQSGFEWEFIMPLGTTVKNDWRLAWPAFFDKWQGQTAYTMGDIVVPTTWISGSAPFFSCVYPGVSGLQSPDFDGAHVLDEVLPADGSALWKLVGWVTLFEVVAVARAQSHPTQLVVRALEQG